MSVLSDVMHRLRALIFRRSEEREMEEELRFHIEMESEYQQHGGISDAEARRRGLIALGGIERTKEDVRDARGTRLLEDSVGDFTYTLRTLLRSPGFAIVAILTLAIGIGGTTAVFSAVDAVLLQPLPYAQPGQLVRLYQSRMNAGERGFVTPVHYLEIRSRISSFEAVAAILTYDETGADIGVGDSVRRVHVLPISADYFDVVRVHPELGHGFQSEDENGAAVVVLSHQLWEDQLRGDAHAMGRTLVMNGKAYTIAGVMPAGFRDPVAGAIDAWTPMDLTPGRDASNADNHYFTVIARLRPTISIARGQAELNAVFVTLARLYPNAPKDASAQLYPLKEDIVGSSSRALEIMLGAVGLVLVLVCVNIANLLIVRGSERAREFAVRSALGAERARLVRQMLIESLTLALAGDIAGLVVARVSMSAIVALGSGTIPRLTTLSLDPRLLAFSLIIATLSAVGFGLAPALRAARTQPNDVLRGEGRGATSGVGQLRVREWLVVSQVALAFVLLVGAGLLLASFRQLRQLDLGIKPNNVLTFDLHLPSVRYDSTARAHFYDAFAAQVEALPGVRAADGISRLPAIGHYHQWGIPVASGPFANDTHVPGADHRVIAGDYFRAVGIPLIEGRLFDSRDDASAPARLIVSKSFAEQLFPGMSAVGQRLGGGRNGGEIIGVVGDVAVDNEGDPSLYVYHAHRQFAWNRNWALTQVVATTGAPESGALQTAIRRTLAGIDPQLVMYRPTALDDVLGRGVAQRVFTLRILMTFAGVALALSALGLFGVLSYTVKLRAREFGIRLALGAERGVIGRMVLRQGLTVTAIGIGGGLLGALGLSRLMASVVFHVKPLDPAVLIAAVLFMGLVAGVASWLPAHRATAVDVRRVLE